MLLTTQQRNRCATVTATAALLLAINTLWRSFHPPRVMTPEQAAAMAQADLEDTRFVINWVSDSYLNILLLKLGGCIALFAIARWLYAPEKTITFQPDPARPLPSPDVVTDDDEYIDYAEAIAHEVAMWCRNFPWLTKLLRAPILIVAGQPGTGKSSIMQTIAFLRFLLFQTGTEIYDPDCDSNISKGVWVHGTPIGQAKDGAFAAQFHANFEALKQKTFPDNQGHTPIFDEVTKWIVEGYMDIQQFKSFLTNIHQKFRRPNIWSLLGLHSLSVEENTQEKSLPKFTSIRDYAAIIYLESDTDEFGKAKFSGVARIKAGGKKVANDDLTLSRHPSVHITEEFSMAHLIQMLGPLIEYIQPCLSDVTDVESSRSYRLARDLFQQAHGKGATGMLTLAEGLHEHAIGDGLSPRSIARGGEPKWHKVDKELVAKMWRYVMDRATSVNPDDEGFVRVRDLWRHWGDKQKLWSDTQTFKSFLKQLHDAHIGELGDGEWRFNSTLDFS